MRPSQIPLLGGAQGWVGFGEGPITLETAVQPKETKEAKEFEVVVQLVPITRG